MTKSTKFSIPSLSTLFSWNKQRQMSAPRNFLEMEIGPPQTKLAIAATELTHFEDDNSPHHHLSYTSLRDLMPTSRPISPIKRKARESLLSEEKECEDDLFWAGAGGDRPPIKNRLVEQAARAYLLPSCAQTTPPNQFFARYWGRLTSSSGTTGLIQSQPHHHHHHHGSSDDLWAPSRGCVHGCNNGCLSCLPSLLWGDLSRAFRSLFTHLPPQSFLRV